MSVMTQTWIPMAVVLVAACVGAATDLWKYRVYNALTIPLFLTGVVYHTAMGGWGGLGLSLAGGLFGFILLFLPYALGLMGAGDVKLLAGVGAWVGLPGVVVIFIVSSLAAGLIALGLIVYRAKVKESLLTIQLIFYRFAALGRNFGRDDLVEDLSTGPDRRVRVIPYGATIPLGVIGAFVWFYCSG
jgi:prepilin peptidase CpaA